MGSKLVCCNCRTPVPRDGNVPICDECFELFKYGPKKMHRSLVRIILDSLHSAAEAVFPYAVVLLVWIVLIMVWAGILSVLAGIGDLL